MAPGFSFENIQMISLGVNSTATNTTITCINMDNSSSFILKSISEVYIHSLTFIDCEMNVTNVELFTMENCTFSSENSRNTVLIFIKTTVDMSKCVFSQLEGLSVGPYANTGGAIICSNSNITISDSIMDGNQGELGGAIFADSGCYINAQNSTFTNNQAEQGGVLMISAEYLEFTNKGGITFSKCVFSGNSAHDGGVLYAEFQNVDVQLSNFSHNQGIYGGIFYLNESQVDIYDSLFTHNTAEQGGVLFAHNGEINVGESNFTNNMAIRGGALYATDGANMDIYGSYFAHNAVLYAGGVIFTRDNSSTAIYNSIFEHNNANYAGGVLYGIRNQTINIDGSYFSTNVAADAGGVLYYASTTNAHINDSFFINNIAHYDGGVVYAFNDAHTSMYNSSFANNSADYDGGVFTGFNDVNLLIHASHFSNNTSHHGAGAIYYGYSANTAIYDTYFINNLADYYGGALYACNIVQTKIHNSYFANNIANFAGGAFASYFDQVVHIYNSSFINNTAQLCGGAIDGSFNVSMDIRESNFTYNIAYNGGAVYALRASSNIHTCFFANNIVEFAGGALSAFYANTDIHNSFFESNIALYAGGAVNVYYNENTLINGSQFTSNTAHNRGGVIHCAYNTSTDIYDSNFTYNSAPRGGAIFAFDYAYKGIYDSNQFVNFSGTTILQNNEVTDNGGAILAVESTVFVNGQLIVANNSALRSGGGIYLHQSQLGIRGNCTIIGNYAKENGGGLFSISSSIALQGNEDYGSSLTFTQNEASLGGGLFIVLNSKLYVVFLSPVVHTFYLMDNVADYGAAIYVADEANQETCIGDIYSPIPTSSRACFLQTIELLSDENTIIDDQILKRSFNFTNNNAEFTGDNLFGGLLDRCTVRFVRRSQQDEVTSLDAGIMLLSSLSNINLNNLTSESISSKPVKVYLCINNEPDYTCNGPVIHVERGESFIISVVAVDQVNHPLNATIMASLSSMFSGLSEGQHSQEVDAACTNLTYTVTAPNSLKEDKIVLYADGPCGDASTFRREIRIRFKQCGCPVGFQRNDALPNSCTCTCHKNITHLVENCNATTVSFTRKENSWISYINTSNNLEDPSTYYLLAHQHCPYDYCITSTQDEVNGINKQCSENRDGILCGKCQPGFSVSIGSSKCIKCTNSWPALLILLFTVALIAGFALVSVILFLNMTVAVGTINGIILYANIVVANSSVLVRLSSPNFPSVFISWINLDIGFDTCLYDGMDTYAKTWLQMAFPTYLIVLIVVVIIGSKYSEKFSSLIGKKNPVATLATLILLSYAKFLSAILNIMSSTELMYPDGRHTLWLPDANIVFLRESKHIFLFLVGILIIVVGAAYTFMLFSWQWLVQLPNWKLFRWTRFSRLNFFIATYNAPYNQKHRYWTGLLLLIRVTLYLVSALNRSGDPKVPLVATIVVIGFLFMLDKDRCKNSAVGFIESTIYLNILVLATFSWYTVDSSGYENLHVATIYISTLIVFAQLVFVIIYHSYRYTKLQQFLGKATIYKSLQRLGLMKEQPKEKRDSVTSTDLHHINRDIDMFEMIDYIPVTQDREPRTESTTVTSPTMTIIDISSDKHGNPPSPCGKRKQMNTDSYEEQSCERQDEVH